MFSLSSLKVSNLRASSPRSQLLLWHGVLTSRDSERRVSVVHRDGPTAAVFPPPILAILLQMKS